MRVVHIWDQVEEIYTKEHTKYLMPVLEYMEQSACSDKIDQIVLGKHENSDVVDYINELVMKCERLEQELYEEQKRNDPQDRY